MSFFSQRVLRKTARRKRAGKDVAASIVLNNAIASDAEGDPRLLIQRGIITGNQQNFSDAADKDRHNRAACYYLAIDSYQSDNLEQAESNLAEALKRSPDNHAAKALLALLEFRKERSLKNLAELSKNLAGVTDVVEAYALYEIESAIIDLNPEESGAAEDEVALKGLAGWVLGSLDDIAALIYWALNHTLNYVINMFDKKRRDAWRNTVQGMLLENFGEREKAMERYRKALLGEPLNRDVLEPLIAYHIETKDPYKADPYLKRLERQAEEEKEYDPHLIRFRADILYLGKSYEQAAKLYTDLTGKEPLAFYNHYRCGLCHIRSGNKTEAVEFLSEALKRINPRLLEKRIPALEKLMMDKPN